MTYNNEHSNHWPDNGRRPYDLATSNADYPAWQGIPSRTILICTHPRSGSTLLGEGLYHAGGLGCPIEYFHRGFRPSLAQRWKAFDIHAFIQSVYRFRTDPTGILSVKLFWCDVVDMVREINPTDVNELFDGPADSVDPETYLKIRGALASIFPDPIFIFLTRQDRVRQAVSALIATQTKFWRSIPGVGEQKQQCDAIYDYDQIMYFLSYSDHCNSHWNNFFQSIEEPVYKITYEKLDRNYNGVLTGLLEHLGCSTTLQQPRMQRQSGNTSERMVLRFLKEYKERSLEMSNSTS